MLNQKIIYKLSQDFLYVQLLELIVFFYSA